MSTTVQPPSGERPLVAGGSVDSVTAVLRRSRGTLWGHFRKAAPFVVVAVAVFGKDWLLSDTGRTVLAAVLFVVNLLILLEVRNRFEAAPLLREAGWMRVAVLVLAGMLLVQATRDVVPLLADDTLTRRAASGQAQRVLLLQLAAGILPALLNGLQFLGSLLRKEQA